MANLLVQPYSGPHSIDLSPLDGILKDVNAGGTRGLRREKPGIEKVENEIKANVPLFTEILSPIGDMPGRFDAVTQKLAKIRAARVIVDKLAEVLAESEAYYEDERENEVSVLVNVARDAARRKDPNILTAFEETFGYYSQIASRAVKTRRKNDENLAEEEANGQHGDEAQGAVAPAVAPQTA
jgi:hypothetical protein